MCELYSSGSVPDSQTSADQPGNWPGCRSKHGRLWGGGSEQTETLPMLACEKMFNRGLYLALL